MTARLRENVVEIASAVIEPEYLSAFHAALDTLIAYHRAASAVEALDETLTAFQKQDEPNTYEWAIVRKALVAAQARLALLEQGRPAYSEETP